jgi:acetyl esterase/lipase
MKDAKVRGVKAATVYYANTSNYEQSLDVYVPSVPPPPGPPLPLVVLVVGSAWLGHRSAIYLGTSWWNSAGPMSVARTGAVCVCVRHRGAFPQPPPWYVLVVLLLITWPVFLPVWPVFLPVWPVFLLVWHLAARGAACHDDMLDDVCTALKWVLANRSALAQAAPTAAPTDGAAGSGSDFGSSADMLPPLVFGGYSSGAHVATSLLQRPALLAARGLPPPAELCDGVLLLSGVLGTRLTAPRTSPLAPALSNLILFTAFGVKAAAALPSPVHDVERSPRLPHLLLGCKHEVFGLPLVEAAFYDVLFCSREVTRRLQALGVPAELHELPSDHWFMLGSAALHEALAAALRDRRWPLNSKTESKKELSLSK